MKKSSPKSVEINLPVSKQTAGGVTGAVIGSAIAGPVGAVVGAVAGTIMGNRSAKGKSLVPVGTMNTARKAVSALEKKLPARKVAGAFAKSVKTQSTPVKAKSAVKGRTQAANKPGAKKPTGKRPTKRAK
jgi:hypothetical protein